MKVVLLQVLLFVAVETIRLLQVRAIKDLVALQLLLLLLWLLSVSLVTTVVLLVVLKESTLMRRVGGCLWVVRIRLRGY